MTQFIKRLMYYWVFFLLGKTSLKLNIQLSKMKKGAKSEEKLKRLHKINIRGPRVKHVCRSASLVLGQPLATFTGNFSHKFNLI